MVRQNCICTNNKIKKRISIDNNKKKLSTSIEGNMYD
jgi:hypothetical protein